MEKITQMEEMTIDELKKIMDKYTKIKSIINIYKDLHVNIQLENINNLMTLSLSKLDDKIEKLQLISDILKIQNEINDEIN